MKTPQSKSTKLDEIRGMIYDMAYDHLTENGIEMELPKVMTAIQALIESKVLEGRRDELETMLGDDTVIHADDIADRLAELEATPDNLTKKG